MRKSYLIAALLGSLILALVIIAVDDVTAVPQKISFQGMLKDSAGSPISGSKSVTFRIYGSPTGGMVLWSETQTITVEGGLYSVRLGEVNPLDLSVFAEDMRYLGISLDDSELYPRTMILSVPYAYRCSTALTAESIAYGTAGSFEGTTFGVKAIATGNSGTGVIAVCTGSNTTGISSAVLNGIGIAATSSNGGGLVAVGTTYGIQAAGTTYGIQSIASAGPGIQVTGTTYGVEATGSGTGVQATGTTYGVEATAGSGTGVLATGTTFGIESIAGSGVGVQAIGITYGISAEASNGAGIAAKGTTYGVQALATAGTGYGVNAYGPEIGGKFAASTDGNGYAGYFDGGRGIKIPHSTAQTTGTAEGAIRYDNSSKHFYGYTDTGWKQLDN